MTIDLTGKDPFATSRPSKITRTSTLALPKRRHERASMPYSYIPPLMTVGGTLLAAAFTSVIAQYLFAPALEARKQRLLDRSRAAATTVQTLREMQFWLEATLIHMRLGDLHYTSQRAKFDERASEFDALLSLAHSDLSTKYTTLALNTQIVTDIYSLLDEPTEKQIEAIVTLLTHTIGALDPVNPPWTRSRHCRKGSNAAEIILDATGQKFNVRPATDRQA